MGSNEGPGRREGEPPYAMKVLDKDHNLIDADFVTWNNFRNNPEKKRVGLDTVHGYRISTVFLSSDHGFGGKPLWFETMIFRGDGYRDLYCDRYETYDEALAGHARIVEMVKIKKEEDWAKSM